MVFMDYSTQSLVSSREELISFMKPNPVIKWVSLPSMLKDWFINSTRSSKLNMKRNSLPRVRL